MISIRYNLYVAQKMQSCFSSVCRLVVSWIMLTGKKVGKNDYNTFPETADYYFISSCLFKHDVYRKI